MAITEQCKLLSTSFVAKRNAALRQSGINFAPTLGLDCEFLKDKAGKIFSLLK